MAKKSIFTLAILLVFTISLYSEILIHNTGYFMGQNNDKIFYQY